MTTIEFNSKFYQMSSILQSFAYNLTRNVEDARDLFQDTAFRAMSNRDKFRQGTNFKAWIFTIMKNIFINNYRKKIRANTVLDSTDNQFFINSSTAAAPNSAEMEMTLQELSKMIAALDDSIRIPFELHFEGFRYQEIAEQLDLPLGTIKSRIFFARKELKDNVLKFYGNAFRNSKVQPKKGIFAEIFERLTSEDFEIDELEPLELSAVA
jgi:RNA polymerase sigma-70 factor (ECF subfamily)